MIKKNSGQSLIEVVVALGIFALSMTAAFQVFFGGQKLVVDSQNSELAINYAQQGADAVKAIRDRNWPELTSGEHVLVFNGFDWMFASSGLSEAIGDFARTISIYDVTDNIKIATTTVTWSDGAVTKTIDLVEELTNWEDPLQSSCKTDPLTGDWTNPQVVSSIDLGAGNSGTDVVVDLPYVYMSGVAASASKPDIFIYDVSNPAVPVLIGSLDIGSGGINTIVKNGNYIYGASPNDTKELVVIDVSSPTAPTLTGYLSLSGSSDALSVEIFGSTVMVGRTSSATYEINFINVSNPASPSVFSEVTTGGNIFDAVATTDRLFVLSKDSDEDIFIYDITNPSNPVFVNTHDIEGTTEDLSLYLHYKGGKRNLMVGNEENELVMLGATTTTQMYVRDRLNVGGEVNDIVCATGDLAFLSTTNTGKEFLVVNVANPDAMTEYASLNFPQVGTGIDYADNMVFMSVRSNDALRIITAGQ
ncbi:MAG: prepilin-type N-terminal cleavage/methylation domain-containing protein [bacterium]|nr:prepilin-type N-terminal cleavage/methylation domain-containing protein [bacterium]